MTLRDDLRLTVGAGIARCDDEPLPNVRLAWKLQDDLKLSLACQNLSGSPAEYSPSAARSETARVLHLKLVWQP